MQDFHTQDRQQWLRELQGTKPKAGELLQWLLIFGLWAGLTIGFYLLIAGG